MIANVVSVIADVNRMGRDVNSGDRKVNEVATDVVDVNRMDREDEEWKNGQTRDSNKLINVQAEIQGQIKDFSKGVA